MTDESVPLPVLSVSAVAARLGVAPSTLRTWDRRYALGPSEHTAGSHRRYTGSDIARLMIMRRLTLEGVTSADAAKIALATAVDNKTANLLVSEEEGQRGVPRVTGLSGAILNRKAATMETAADDAVLGFTAQQLAQRKYDTDICLALTKAAKNFDELGAIQLVQAVSDARGVGDTWAQIVKHAVVELLTSSQLVQPGMDPLSVVKLAVMTTLRRAARRNQQNQDASTENKPTTEEPAEGRVMVCASSDEVSSMGAHVLAAALNQSRTPAAVLLGQVKASVVRKTLQNEDPAVIIAVSWAEPSEQMDSAIRACLDLAPNIPVLLNGPGWSKKYPPGAHRVRSFIAALHETKAYVS